MKINLYLLLLGLFFAFSGFAQKHDYIWTYGNRPSPGFPDVHFQLNFNETPPQIEPLETALRFSDVGISMCDSLGNLLFYSNGTKIYNWNHELMENGDTLGHINSYIKFRFVGLEKNMGNFALPDPRGNNRYYMFYTSYPESPEYPNGSLSTYLYVLEVDMNANGGKGKVTHKNKILKWDYGLVTSACKHGNGRDWWLITTQVEKHDPIRFTKFLISSNGIEGPFIDTLDIDPFQMQFHRDFGKSSLDSWVFPPFFSPDGNYYFHSAKQGGWLVTTFDRCLGEFSTFRDLYLFESAVVAPDSRTLYGARFSNHLNTIRISDTLPDYFPKFEYIPFTNNRMKTSEPYSFMTNMTLGPDGKIYGLAASWGSSDPIGYGEDFQGFPYLHIIHNPNLGEMSADAEFNGLALPGPNYKTSHLFPHYRLGRSLGAPCDTIMHKQTPDPAFNHFPYNPIPPMLPQSISYEQWKLYEETFQEKKY